MRLSSSPKEELMHYNFFVDLPFQFQMFAAISYQIT